MESKNDIRKELEALAPGASWPGAFPRAALPEGYFAQLPGLVLRRLSGEEEPPALPAAGPAPLGVPEGYFEGLPAAVMTRVQLRSRVRRRRMGTLAAAAVMAGLVLGAALWLRPEPAAPSRPLAGLAAVPDADILQYLSVHATEALDMAVAPEGRDILDRQLSAGVSDDDLLRYLETHSLDGY